MVNLSDMMIGQNEEKIVEKQCSKSREQSWNVEEFVMALKRTVQSSFYRLSKIFLKMFFSSCLIWQIVKNHK